MAAALGLESIDFSNLTLEHVATFDDFGSKPEDLRHFLFRQTQKGMVHLEFLVFFTVRSKPFTFFTFRDSERYESSLRSPR